MKLGARIFKTGITLVLAIYLSQLLGLGPIIFAAIAATLAIQPSVYRSWRYGIEQVQSNLIGATIAIIFANILGTSPLFIALAVMFVIGLNLQLHFERTIPLSIVTVLSIMEGGVTGTGFYFFAFDRFLLIFIGLISAILVNSLLFPPRYEKQLTERLKNIEEQITSLLRIILDRNKNEQFIRNKIKEMEEELTSLWTLFDLELETKSYLRKKLSFTSSRRLAIFKSMLLTTKSAIDTLRIIERNQPSLKSTNEATKNDLMELLQNQLLDLANYHERIFSKYGGIIHSSNRHNINENLFYSSWNIYKQLIATTDDPKLIIEVNTIISYINEYTKYLDHLERLIDSYHTHHVKK